VSDPQAAPAASGGHMDTAELGHGKL
jgi:hypothetical protein